MITTIKPMIINMTGDRSSIKGIFLVESKTRRLERREGGPYSKLTLSISFLVFSFAGSEMILEAIKASTATPKKQGRIIFAELIACLQM